MIGLLLVFHPKNDQNMTARIRQVFGAQLNKLGKRSPCHVGKAGDNVDCRNGDSTIRRISTVGKPLSGAAAEVWGSQAVG
jgi:hypothetical protein